MSKFLKHTGTPQMFDYDPHGSGRYRQGSGKNPHQHGFDFLYEIKKLKESGDFKDETEIARYLGYSTTEYRAKKSILKAEKEREDIARVKHMYYDQQRSKSAIAKELGMSDTKVSNILKDCESVKNIKLRNTEEMLLKSVKEKEWIDVSEGVEKDLGISKPMMKAALKKIEEDGEYVVKKIQVPQINSGTGQKTTTLVLCPTGTTARDLYLDLGKINLINDYYSEDLGLTILNMERPAPVDSKRIGFTYADKDGYQPKDGIIELRPGVEDLSLGDSKYAQVRINVDDKYYLKGMAYYNPDLPKGMDIRFNSNKPEGTPMEKVLKPMQTTNGEPGGPIDWDNPFGANLKAGGQSHYIGKDGKKHLSAINKLTEEGDWGEWSRTLAAQFLSKQPLELAKKQLNITYLNKISEFEEIKTIPNTTVRKYLLNSFADDCDASAEELKATSMPRQATQVLLALENVKENEVYAPNFHEGEHVALVRYPHSGPCEILNLKVNNKNKEAIKLFGKTPKDCVVVNPKALPKLSGADCDGDNVVVIPNKKIGKDFVIRVDPMLEGLRDFDPHIQYAASPGCKLIKTDAQKGIEMGKAANLIADMYLKGANPNELAKAIRHSMVVIDAKKHKLDYKASEKDNDIKNLRIKYQGNAMGGASTLITRAKSPVDIPKRSMYFHIDPDTGKKIYSEPTIKTKKVWNKDDKGNWSYHEEPLMETISKMSKAENAFELLSDPKAPYDMEVVYGTYANAMKKMANDARKEAYWTKSQPVSSQAQKAYAEEIESLIFKNNAASRNAQYERKAQRAATVIIKEKKEANPGMSKKELSKKSQQALNACRARYIPGGRKERVNITEREMEAINNNALNSTLVNSILKNTKTETLMDLALPKKQKGLSTSKIAAAKAMLNSGLYTQDEIAKKFGISATTLMRYVKGN